MAWKKYIDLLVNKNNVPNGTQTMKEVAPIARYTELRKLPAAALFNIAYILDIDDDWEKIVPLIPKDWVSNKFVRKYNSEHVRLIKKHATNTNRKCAEVLFEEWGTSGRVRPTVNTLMNILCEAQIFRAADEIARLLNEPPPRRPRKGPAAKITEDISELLSEDNEEENMNENNTLESEMLPDFNELLPEINEFNNYKTKASERLPDLNKFVSKMSTMISQLQTEIFRYGPGGKGFLGLFNNYTFLFVFIAIHIILILFFVI